MDGISNHIKTAKQNLLLSKHKCQLLPNERFKNFHISDSECFVKFYQNKKISKRRNLKIPFLFPSKLIIKNVDDLDPDPIFQVGYESK